MITKISTIVLSLVFAVHSAQAVGLANGGFENPALGTAGDFYPYNSPPAGFGWTIGFATGIDLIGSYWQAASGQQSIDLSGFGPAVIYQDFTFASAGTWL
jgi:hypothetical protein